MYCNCLICLNRNTKWNTFFPKLPHFVLLDKIIVVVFWTDAKRLVLNRLLDSYYIFAEEDTKFRKKASWLLTWCAWHTYYGASLGTGHSYQGHLWAQGIITKVISGHRAFLLRPSMDPGFLTKFLQRDLPRAGAQGSSVVIYHWGSEPGKHQKYLPKNSRIQHLQFSQYFSHSI